MITLYAMWTPGPLELIIIMFGIFFVAISLAFTTILTRWIFRINEQIELLIQIKDELRKLRLKKYPENREVEQ